jgi:L-gulonolactone oxidase
VKTLIGQVGLTIASKSHTAAKLLNKLQPSMFRSQIEIDSSPRIFHRFPGHQKVYSMEYIIPIEHTRDALQAIKDALLATGFVPNLSPYLRFIGGAGDGDLSPMRGRQSCAIEVLSFVTFKGWEAFFRNLEPRFLALGGRPHWGKIFYANPKPLYDAATWAHVEKLRRQLDPDRKFANEVTWKLLR